MSAMQRFTKLLQRLTADHGILVLVTFAVVAALGSVAGMRVRVDARIESLMIAHDPELAQSAALKTRFSNDEVLILAFELGHPFTASDLRTLARLSKRIAAVDGVEEVIDLSNVEDIRGKGDALDASPLIDLDTVESQIPALHERVRDHRLYERLLVSRELDVVAMIVVQPPPDAAKPAASKTMVEAVHRVLDEERLPWTVHRVGAPESEVLADRLLRTDLAMLGIPALVLVLCVVYAASRQWFALVLTVVLVAWSEIMLIAYLALSDTPLTMVTALAPVILIAPVSLSGIYAIGLLQELKGHCRPAIGLIDKLTAPTIVASVSNCIGFSSLRFFGVEGVAELGTALTVGIAGATVAMLLLVPTMIDRFGFDVERVPLEWMRSIGSFGVRLAARPWTTAAVAGVVLAASVPGLFRLRIETDPLKYFRQDHQHVRSTTFVGARLAGTRILDVVIETGEAGGALEPAVLTFAADLSRELTKFPVVQRTLSFLDYTYLMDAAMLPEKAPREVLPSRELAAQYLLLYEMGGNLRDLRHYLDADQSSLNLLVRLTTVSTERILALRDFIARYAAQYRGAPKVSVLGHAYLFAKASDGIARGMARGLVWAVLTIVFIMAVTLRSVRLALIAAIPNVVPILVCGGVLGWLDIPLSLGTSLVGCIALGLAVDDTAHIMAHIDPALGLRHTYALVSRPVVLSALSLGLGFSVLVFSQFQTIAMLGLATALTLLVALACELLMMPSLLVLAGYPIAAAADCEPLEAHLVRVAS
jgi:uncharacterized protein